MRAWTVTSGAWVVGKLDRDGFTSVAARGQCPVEHLDCSLGFRSQVESDEANTF